ncbi:MAG: endonuclease MutS2, partial [Firmicutes bacterium]|nr:endonuclease MutS2 [Bacillota bacterium]
MDERSRRVLEFPEIIERLAAETTFAPGRELASQLLPETDPDEVRRRLAETAEALKFVDEAGTVLAGARDVRPAVARARIGGVLSGSELLDVAATAACAGRLRRIFLAEPETCPQLAAHALRLGTFAELEEAITACIGPDGQVIDDASPTLKRLRADIRAAQSRVRERLDAVVRSANLRPALQEPLVTVRNGRPVVPVKQEHKHLIPGVVHDTSASGATVFVEPLVVFELNNELQELRVREAREVDRILARLSAQAGEAADALLATVESLARIDLAMAKARLARSMRAVAPKMNEDSFIRIAGGRHPLLPGEPVPIDVRLGRDIRALVITGPNTGGKTVTLKTIGLFSLMAQAGLFVPAEPGTELAIFRGIYADIGDEQSIQQNLSTFSSHMSNIVAILRQAGPGCLVLLDELGAGTDPAEGAALAMAILDHLSGAGALCVATSHYSELKAFAHSRPGMENASVEFDPDTLRPTYRLQMGLPGRSMALAVAARLGLPGEVLENARGRLAREDLRVDELIHNLEASRREAEAELATAPPRRAAPHQRKAKRHAPPPGGAAPRDEPVGHAPAPPPAVRA